MDLIEKFIEGAKARKRYCLTSNKLHKGSDATTGLDCRSLGGDLCAPQK